MNLRTIELAKQAGYEKDNFGVGHWNMPEFRKFVELIVFECTKAVQDGTIEGDHYVQRIEQHFNNTNGGILHSGVD